MKKLQPKQSQKKAKLSLKRQTVKALTLRHQVHGGGKGIKPTTPQDTCETCG